MLIAINLEVAFLTEGKEWVLHAGRIVLERTYPDIGDKEVGVGMQSFRIIALLIHAGIYCAPFVLSNAISPPTY
jgi:hypothetical protein